MTLNSEELLQNRYRIISTLGRGGMGAVYRAWHLNLGVPLAIKEMLAQPGIEAQTLVQLRHQFQQEASVLARLDHSHLVSVIDFFEEKGNAYLVMHLIEGESLADRIEREGALPEEQVLTWAAQLLDGLAYCHDRGVIHRDVKPQNIIIRPDGCAVLVDFGLVKLWDPHDPYTRTAMRGMGTPEYAPPEQYGTQSGHTDPRSDLYSMGATLYHALAGQAPLSANDRVATPDRFVPVRALNPQASRETEEAVLKAMELPLANRFHSAQEMVAAIEGGAPVRTRSDAYLAPGRQTTEVMPGMRAVAPTRPKRAPARAWIVGIVAFIAVAALLIALGKLVFGWGTVKDPTSAKLVTSTFAATLIPTLTDEPTTAPTQKPTVQPSVTPVLEPTLAAGFTRIRPIDGMSMVYVPSGTFWMGSDSSDDNADSDELPRHSVVLDAFWIDQTEVTNAQFAAFLNAQGNQTEGGVTWLELEGEDYLIEQVEDEYQPKSGYADYPITEVSWYGADAYCEWAGVQLPTEAQWEYAARGTQGYVYPWGNTQDGTRLNFCDANCTYEWKATEDADGYERTAPVNGYQDGASWCNALNMAGNVWEWVADWYGDYPLTPQTNPTGSTIKDSKVFRGGSWCNNWFDVRATSRNSNTPDTRYVHIGFRCAGDAPGE